MEKTAGIDEELEDSRGGLGGSGHSHKDVVALIGQGVGSFAHINLRVHGG